MMRGALTAVVVGFFGMLGGFVAASCKGMVLARVKKLIWRRLWRRIRGSVRARQVLALLDLLPTDFPEMLGPIQLFDVPSMTELYDPKRHRPQDSGETGNTWQIRNFRLMEETGVALPHGTIDMHMTEEVEVRFGQIRRKHLGIPEKAAFFRWCYPCSHAGLALDANNDDHLAVASLLETGGWMYFDRDHKLLTVKTITPAKDCTADTLSFKKHDAWRPEWTESLQRRNRFHPITLDFMLEAGARYFVWLKPNERIGDGDQQPVIPHGGFAYLFHAPGEPSHSKSKLDCYFAVEPFSSFPTLYKQHRRTDGDPRVHQIQVQVRFYLTDPESRLQRRPGEWLEIQRLEEANCMRRIGGTRECIIEAVSRSTDMEVDPPGERVRRLPPNAGAAR